MIFFTDLESILNSRNILSSESFQRKKQNFDSKSCNKKRKIDNNL